MAVEDLTEPLSRIYGSSAIYVEQIEKLGEKNGTKSARCFYTVSSIHANRPDDPPALDGFEPHTNGKPVGILNVTPGHTVGHFKQTPVFPGHKGIRAAVAYVDTFVNSSVPYHLHPNQVRLSSFDSVVFKGFVLPGTQLKVFESGDDLRRRTLDIEIKKGDDVITEINGLRVIFHPTERPLLAELLEDQLIEAMVQSAAATALDLNQELDGIPMFQSIGRTSFSFDRALEGLTVEMRTETTAADKRGFIGNVKAYVDRKEIAQSFDTKAMIITKRIAERMMGIKLDKS